MNILKIWPLSLICERFRRRRERIEREDSLIEWRRLVHISSHVQRDMMRNPQDYPDEENPYSYGD